MKKDSIKRIIDQTILAEKLLKKGDIDSFGELLRSMDRKKILK